MTSSSETLSARCNPIRVGEFGPSPSRRGTIFVPTARVPAPYGSAVSARRKVRPVAQPLGPGVSSSHVPAHQPALAEPAVRRAPTWLDYRVREGATVNLIDRERFDVIKQTYGSYASWAVWAPATRGPKSNIDDLRIFDLAANPTTLDTLNGSVVMVGLNISRSFVEPFRNFHDSNPNANDFKIRHAFASTAYYGAYMTDIIKNVELVRSADLRSYLRAHPNVIHSNVATFRQELRDLPCRRPTILAFGLAAYNLLAENLLPEEYSSLIRLTHYSHQIGKEEYRETVLAQISASSATRLPNESAANSAVRGELR
jgi:hypothetical protein